MSRSSTINSTHGDGDFPGEDGSAFGADGTRLRYRTYGSAGPWLVIANGHGATFGVWSDLFRLLSQDIRILIWHYRGQHTSDLPADPRANSIDDHCDDLDHLLDALGIEHYMMAGWSIGVQVALGQYRRSPEQIDGLVLIHGAPDQLVSRVFGGAAARLLHPSVRMARHTAPWVVPVIKPVVKRWLKSRTALPVFKGLGLIDVDSEDFRQLALDYADLDYGAYMQMVLSAHGHRTEDWLHEINVPTLVTVGHRDGLTPPHQLVSMRDLIPDVTWVEFEGTHFPMIEEPKKLADLILSQFAKLNTHP